jgi:hypothetical protein
MAGGLQGPGGATCELSARPGRRYCDRGSAGSAGALFMHSALTKRGGRCRACQSGARFFAQNKTTARSEGNLKSCRLRATVAPLSLLLTLRSRLPRDAIRGAWKVHSCLFLVLNTSSPAPSSCKRTARVCPLFSLSRCPDQ